MATVIDVVTGLIRRTRQNHGLEHATIHLLGSRMRGVRISGLSDGWGFWLFGNLTQPVVLRATSDALLRLQAGESHLAIHPNCGTNLLVKIVLASVAALLAQLGKRPPLDQLVRTMLFMLPALLISEPLGYRVQSYTTSPHVADRWIVGVQRIALGPVVIHRVTIE